MEEHNIKKSYFVSDVHLGAPDYDDSLKREKRLVKWLQSIEHDAENLFILGDIFDMWFDYKHVVPRGYVRLLGQLANMSDA
ncbi:MAG: UDP-2,3-diacylglucosamine hydrolase, partial [Bacteroidetes bacterium 4572_112]